MSHNLRAALLAALIAGAAPLLAHGPSAGTAVGGTMSLSARAAAGVVDSFHAALRRGDQQSALALLANDALIFEAGGVERSKAEYASHHLAADAAFSQAVPLVLTRRAGEAVGDLAWIASEGRIAGTYKGKAVDRVTAETILLRRTGGGWRIVHIHWSSAASQ